jgi:hypothetical protein
MNILVLGHSGFLGHKFLDFLNHNYKGIFIVGISDDITGSKFKNLTLSEYSGFKVASEANIDWNFDLVFNFVHSQRSKNVMAAEKNLAEKVVKFLKDKDIEAPLVMLRSVGEGSDHIISRISFDEIIKKNLENRVIEIRASIIEEEDSVSYEIPFRVLKRTRLIPRFPWMGNQVSLIKANDLFVIFKRIIDGEENKDLITPEHRTMTYEEPFNDFTFTPFLVKMLTGLDHNIVRNLMKTLKNDSVL